MLVRDRSDDQLPSHGVALVGVVARSVTRPDSTPDSWSTTTAGWLAAPDGRRACLLSLDELFVAVGLDRGRGAGT